MKLSIRRTLPMLMPPIILFPAYAFYLGRNTLTPQIAQPTPNVDRISDKLECNALAISVPRFGSAAGRMMISNGTHHHVRIDTYTSTCSCIRIQISKDGLKIPAQRTAELAVEVDLSKETGEIGDFAPQILFEGMGLTSSLHAEIRINVRASRP